jgi:hypothetical protein
MDISTKEFMLHEIVDKPAAKMFTAAAGERL